MLLTLGTYLGLSTFGVLLSIGTNIVQWAEKALDSHCSNRNDIAAYFDGFSVDVEKDVTTIAYMFLVYNIFTSLQDVRQTHLL